ncbi:hypothetical protein BH10PSE7_BH10PSE7_33270 [soil metagenome]
MTASSSELAALRKAILGISMAVHDHLPADGISQTEFVDRVIEILADPEISLHVTRLEEKASRAADEPDEPPGD